MYEREWNVRRRVCSAGQPRRAGLKGARGFRGNSPGSGPPRTTTGDYHALPSRLTRSRAHGRWPFACPRRVAPRSARSPTGRRLASSEPFARTAREDLARRRRPPSPALGRSAYRSLRSPSAHGCEASVRMVCETFGFALFAFEALPTVASRRQRVSLQKIGWSEVRRSSPVWSIQRERRFGSNGCTGVRAERSAQGDGTYSRSITAFVTSSVLASPPRSGVRGPFSSVDSTAS